MWKFIKYELKYWLKSPMTWIFLLINTLLVMGAVSSDNISIGGGVGSVYKNAPFVIQNYYGFLSMFCLLMTTAFMNATANRDFQYGMHQFIFTSPISKRDYFFGKFTGAFVIAVLPMIGVSVGALIGPFMPWAQPDRFGAVLWSGHMWGLIAFAIPNVFISGVLLFGLSVIFRNNIVSFVGAMTILVFYVISSGFIDDIEKEWLATILDPFGFRPLGIISKYMTINEKNQNAFPLTGLFLYNRLIWLSIALVGLFLLYSKFSLSTKNTKVNRKTEDPLPHSLSNLIKTYVPNQKEERFISFWNMVKFETKSIITNNTFLIILLIGAINLVASLSSFTRNYGTKQYPVTYDIIETIHGSFYMFLIGFITFYSGVLVWKERDFKMSEIQDASPVSTSKLFSSKIIAICFSTFIVLCTTILIGLIVQILNGYSRVQIDVYVKYLLILDFFSFVSLIAVALFFHYTINNRYIAYFAFITFIVLNTFIWGALKISTNLVKYGNTPSIIYSDMNGFGPFIETSFWFSLYWLIGAFLISFITYFFFIRGKEEDIHSRWFKSKIRFSKNKVLFWSGVAAFILCGSYIYYNTIVLNKVISSNESEEIQIEYEKKYKKYENIARPKFYKFDYNIEIFPEERDLKTKVHCWVRNTTPKVIDELHFTMPTLKDSVHIEIPGGTIEVKDDRCGYRIYNLKTPLKPGDSMEMTVSNIAYTKGFENEVSFTQLTHNGTFFNNMDIMPFMGYNSDFEVSDKNKRIKFKLPKKQRSHILDENNLRVRDYPYISDADWVELTTTISTSADQIAVAPGSLVSVIEKGGRKTFRYQLDHKSLNFYSFISARYEVERKKFKGIDIEVYYHKEHGYNIPNMVKSIEKSLDYYTKNFGPYYHKQCRIIEFPGYAGFAQAFPGTMPYSEDIGFITDLRGVTADDIDLVFYVVAHEMGHQYWAHQVCGPKMQGSEMMSEGFAQYSALMVMEKEYGKDKMKKFLKYETDGYLAGRGQEFEAERPLMKSEGQGYIHYQKASSVMYYLKEMIGEEKVNEALKSLIDTFAYKKPPLPTSLSAIRAFRKVTPDSLQYLISDLFENITIFSNRVKSCEVKKLESEYEVTIHTLSEKFYSDSLGKETIRPLNDYIDIGIFGKNKSEYQLGKPLVYKRVKLNKKENSYSFKIKEKPYQVGIDPYNFLIDRIPDDNVKKVE